MRKLIIRFPNKNLTKEERDKVIDTFLQCNMICIDKELEVYELYPNNEIVKIF
jgi:hypothetical protein